MVTRNADSSQGDGGSTCPPPAQADQLRSRAGNTVFKSGPLLISSKGIGWTSWKKRWFILTRTSLVFFRSDPSVVPQKSSEVNLTLGGIDLNNSGSVVVKEDKKLLTVLFPDGRDGRAFTLKAETSEDLYEWKNALETALTQAPSATLVMGQNGIFRNDTADSVDGTLEQCRDKQPLKSLIVGRPILLALEDIDGTPSFLEKALRFVELYGVKVEGVLRQAADVDDVERRIREYEQGKNEFSPEEDAHVIADCVKYVLRELPSSPVPASCCNALLEAYRSDRGVRINAMRTAIAETFPEPNCRLLQRILKMMQSVASHKVENRMSLSAVAACMAPLLLRPLLAGDCELGNDFKMGGDGSVQLLQAAAAANHAQAIVITLLEEYDNIFGDDQLQDGSYTPELYSDSEESGSEDEEASDDDEDIGDDDCSDSQHDLDAETEVDPKHAVSGSCSEESGNGGDDLNDDEVQVSEGANSTYKSSAVAEKFDANQESSSEPQASVPQDSNVQNNNNLNNEENTSLAVLAAECCESLGDVSALMVRNICVSTTTPVHEAIGYDQSLSTSKSRNKKGPVPCAKRQTVWGRTAAKKNLSSECIDYPSEEEAVIQRLEVTRIDLKNRIAKEEKGNVILLANLEKRKLALHGRRLALEQEVARLQEQLQRERDLREALEAGLGTSLGHFPASATLDCKTKADLEEIAVAEADVINLGQKVADLHVQLDQQCQQNNESVKHSHCHYQQTPNHQATLEVSQQKAVETTEPAHPHERTKISMNTSLEGGDWANVRTQEYPSLSNKNQPQKQKLDSVYDRSTKSVEVPPISSAVLSVVVEPTASSNSEKSGTKDENFNLALTSNENVKTLEPPSLSNRQSPQKQQVHSTSQGTKSDPPSSSSQQPPQKQQVDSTSPGTKSNPPSSSSQQPPQKQQVDSTSHRSNKSAGVSAMEPNASTNSKKSGSKGEGTVSTSSALTKLTTRLNFLKERRNQIVNELQNLDKGRGSEGQSVSAPPRTSSR